MLKLDVTYETFDEETVTEPFYFNISEPELIEMEVSYTDGWSATLTRAMEYKDMPVLVKIFKDLLLQAYGEKSTDGKHFVKSDEIRTKFSQTAAYVKMFTDLATNDQFAADFIIGVMPKSLAKEFEAAATEAKAISAKNQSGVIAPPVPPTA
jgi:hypothetical protein